MKESQNFFNFNHISHYTNKAFFYNNNLYKKKLSLYLMIIWWKIRSHLPDSFSCTNWILDHWPTRPEFRRPCNAQPKAWNSQCCPRHHVFCCFEADALRKLGFEYLFFLNFTHIRSFRLLGRRKRPFLFQGW